MNTRHVGRKSGEKQENFGGLEDSMTVEVADCDGSKIN